MRWWWGVEPPHKRDPKTGGPVSIRLRPYTQPPMLVWSGEGRSGDGGSGKTENLYALVHEHHVRRTVFPGLSVQETHSMQGIGAVQACSSSLVLH